MSSGIVDADPESIRRIASALTHYQEDIADAAKQVEGALKEAHWHDPQRDHFEEWYTDLRRKIASLTGSDVTDVIRDLGILAQQLEDLHPL